MKIIFSYARMHDLNLEDTSCAVFEKESTRESMDNFDIKHVK